MKIVKIVLSIIAVLGIVVGCLGFIESKRRNDECGDY